MGRRIIQDAATARITPLNLWDLHPADPTTGVK